MRANSKKEDMNLGNEHDIEENRAFLMTCNCEERNA
jgi:hypothetical protein